MIKITDLPQQVQQLLTQRAIYWAKKQALFVAKDN